LFRTFFIVCNNPALIYEKKWENKMTVSAAAAAAALQQQEDHFIFFSSSLKMGQLIVVSN
jgi:hypothetical protein